MSPSNDHSARSGLRDIGLLAGVLALWLIVHGVFWGRLIYHDSWTFNFPVQFGIAKNMACSGMPDWFGMVDSGTPLSIYNSSFTLTNPLRLASLFLVSCLNPGVSSAVYAQKICIFALYLFFAAGMYVMGRILYRQHLCAVYLFAASLFAGLCMETVHSDQSVLILFWLPWIVGCLVRFHRARRQPRAHWYLNAAVLLIALQALDHLPHLTAFAAGLGLLIYAALEPRALLEGLRLHWKRLWPAALALAATAAHLFYVWTALGDYASSLRYAMSTHTELRIALSRLSETGFAQPAAFIGSFLPLTLTRAFDSLADNLRAWYFAHVEILQSDRRFFVYQVDEVMFFVGIIPAALTAAFLMRPGLGRLRAGWGLFALMSVLVALQQTRLYMLIFELPFFDVFRAYLHLLFFGVFAILVMSGYGMDALLTLAPKERRRLAGRALGVTAGLVAVAGLVLAWMFFLPPATEVLPAARFQLPEPNLRLRYAFMLDAAILLAGFAALAWAVYGASEVRRGMAVVIGVLALSQAGYQAGVYRILSIPMAEGIARFGLDEADRTPLPAAVAGDPNALERKLCTHFAECYLALRDTTSLRLDHEGTFFRSLGEAVFQPDLAPPVVEALSAVGHPVFWASRRAEPYLDDAALAKRLDAHAADIADYLGQAVAVRAGDLERLGGLPQAGEGAVLSHLSRGIDRLRLSYLAASPFYLNAALAYDPHWRVEVDGKAVAAVRGNFGGIAALLPAGSGTIELRYVDRASELFFASRILMGLAGLAAALWLARGSFRARFPWREETAD